ncbi:MAG: DUF167 domain-containing protein [Fimbriimonadales bacterium]
MGAPATLTPNPMTSWAKYDPERDSWTLQVHIQPSARSNQVVGEHGGRLKVKIAAPPVDDRANACLVTYLAELWGVPTKQVQIISGHRSRQKTVRVSGAGSQVPDCLSRIPTDSP